MCSILAIMRRELHNILLAANTGIFQVVLQVKVIRCIKPREDTSAQYPLSSSPISHQAFEKQ